MRTWLEETLAKHSGRTLEQVSNDIERDKILTAARGRGVRPDRPGARPAARLEPADRPADRPDCAGTAPHPARRHRLTRCAGVGVQWVDGRRPRGTVATARSTWSAPQAAPARDEGGSHVARIGDGGDLLKCSFCGKSQKQVKKLIAGPGVYICDECIDLCNEIIEEELAETSELGPGRAAQAARDLRVPRGVRRRPGRRQAGARRRGLQPLQAHPGRASPAPQAGDDARRASPSPTSC